MRSRLWREGRARHAGHAHLHFLLSAADALHVTTAPVKESEQVWGLWAWRAGVLPLWA